MTKTIAKTYNIVNDNTKLICRMFLFGCLVLIGIYCINMFHIISKTVSLQKIESKIQTLSSSINELDAEYLSLSGKIMPDNISQYGMIKGKVSQYISRSSATGYLGINHMAFVNER